MYFCVCVCVCVCVCSPDYPACKAHALFQIVGCGLYVSAMFLHIMSYKVHDFLEELL